MPRPRSKDPRKVRQAKRQKKYREELQRRGEPEADAVDAALAAALCDVVVEDKAAESKDPVRKAFLSELLKRARGTLVAKGGDRDEVTKVLHRRLHRAEFALARNRITE